MFVVKNRQLFRQGLAAANPLRQFAVELSSAGNRVEVSQDQSGESKARPLYFDNQATTPVDPR